MYSEILKNIETADELHEYKKLIGKLKNKVTFYSTLDRASLKAQLLKDASDSLLMNIIFDTDQEKDIDQTLTELQTALENISELKITLAIEPDENLKGEIVKWVKAKASPYIIVDFATDPSIIAGAILSFRGRYKDYSVNKMFKSRVL